MARAKAVTASEAPKGFKEQGGDVNQMEQGDKVEGVYLGLTPARNEDSSPVIRIETAEGTMRFWAPTILESKLADVEGGSFVIIECLGKTRPVKSRKGSLAWDFRVFVKE